MSTQAPEHAFAISRVPPTLKMAAILRYIETAAHEKSKFGRLLWPNEPQSDDEGPTEEKEDEEMDSRTLGFLKDEASNYFFLVTEVATGKGVAFGWWQYTKGKTDQEWADTYTNRYRSPRLNQKLSDATNGARLLRRPMIVGNGDYFTLKELYVRPEFQRKGLGSRLMKWGVEKADELGLPAYTEASEKGLGLYLRYGFKEVDRITVDLELWGGEKGEVNSYGLLYREAKKL